MIFYIQDRLNKDNSALFKVFNRAFSNAFLKGVIDKDMFIDNPRDHSIQHLSEINDYTTADAMEKSHLELYDEKEAVKTTIENKIRQTSIAKAPLIISISGESGTPMRVTVKTPATSFEVLSEMNLVNTGTEAINYAMVLKRLKAINDTEYHLEKLTLENLQEEVYIPFNALTSIKKRILFVLNGSKEFVDPIDVPVLKKHIRQKEKPTISVLISSPKDVHLCDETNTDVFFRLPESFKNESAELTALFTENRKLIPWFPPVLTGEDYQSAMEFLQQVQPQLIVTNNTGIAYEAFEKGIRWIAGPYLNLVNSFSLVCLKETFNCSGAFISNEISKVQMLHIQIPDDFKLYYSIYHPIVLMTSRQCLLHQVTGCEKKVLDDDCINHCVKSASITNLKKETFLIEKTKGNYHRIYHPVNFLNTAVVTEMADLFSGFFIDLTELKTETKIAMGKPGIIKLFENLLNGDPASEMELRQVIHPTTDTQYHKGI